MKKTLIPVFIAMTIFAAMACCALNAYSQPLADPGQMQPFLSNITVGEVFEAPEGVPEGFAAVFADAVTMGFLSNLKLYSLPHEQQGPALRVYAVYIRGMVGRALLGMRHMYSQGKLPAEENFIAVLGNITFGLALKHAHEFGIDRYVLKANPNCIGNL